MSFRFDWDSFNDDNFYDKVRTLLTDALNKGNKPPILSDRIVVRELYLGEESPQLEILEVGDVADDRFRGIFKLTYNGDASITLATKIQANPLKVYSMSAPGFSTPAFLGACDSLDIPLKLTLSDIRLSGIIILVFSKAKGLTLVFRNDPLQSIRVSSTFDTVPGIARFLQSQIEKQIRSLFREELPAILHRLSHRWTPNGGLVYDSGIPTASANKDDTSESTSKTLFADINPELPLLSTSNMRKVDGLFSNQQTLSLFSPSIPDTLHRANLEEEEERLSGGYVQKLSEAANDLAEIARIQSRNYFRNSHGTPKRRVIKLSSRKTESKPMPQEVSNSSSLKFPNSTQGEKPNISSTSKSIDDKHLNKVSASGPLLIPNNVRESIRDLSKYKTPDSQDSSHEFLVPPPPAYAA